MLHNKGYTFCEHIKDLTPFQMNYLFECMKEEYGSGDNGVEGTEVVSGVKEDDYKSLDDQMREKRMR